MFPCKVCGKKFKAPTELGGHMSSSHGRNRTEDATAPNLDLAEVPIETAPEKAPEGQTELSSDAPGVMENIRALMRQGYTPKQVKEEFGYARRTVDQVGAEFIRPEGSPRDDGGDNKDAEMSLPVTIKGTETVTPESIMQRLANGSDDWHLRLEGMMLLRAAQKMNRDDIEMVRMQAEADAKLIEPVLKLMKETRESQDAAAARARDSSIEIAERAAFEVAQGMKGAFSSEMQGLRAALPGQPSETNPMAKMFFGALQPYLGQMLGQALASVSKTGQQPGAQPQSGQQAFETPGQPVKQSPADNGPPTCMRPGEENEFTEA